MLKNGADVQKVLSGLSSALTRKGHTRLHGSILRGVLRALAYKTVRSGSTVTVASESGLASHKDAIEAAIKHLGGAAEYSTVIDPTIIGGAIIEHNNTIIDTSYKSHLVRLYRRVTK